MADLDAELRKVAGSVKRRAFTARLVKRTTGTVTAVAAGAAADGNSLVTVSIFGGTQAMARLASYTSPTNGDVVIVDLVDGSPLIIGRVIGQPT